MNRDDDGRLYYQNQNGTYTYLPAGVEGEKMANKLKTAQAIVSAVQTLIPATDDATNLSTEYAHVGPFADEDLAPMGITPAQLAACVTLLEQINKFMTNQETVTADFTATLNAVRRV